MEGLKSHPNKKLLHHLERVGELSRSIVESKSIKNKEILADIAYLVGIGHDFAKSTSYFQDQLQGEDEARTKYSSHGYLSALFTYHLTRSHLKRKDALVSHNSLPLVSWIVVLRHHGNIKDLKGATGEESLLAKAKNKDLVQNQIQDIKANSSDALERIYQELLPESFSSQNILKSFFQKLDDYDRSVRATIKKDIRKIVKEKSIDNYLLILFIYSVLLDADKLDASDTKRPKRLKIKPDIIDRYKQDKFGSPNTDLDSKREQFYGQAIENISEADISSKKIFSLDLPTGAGKTLTGLSAALKLRKKIQEKFSFTPRLIYTLPFLSIIDQNAAVIEEVLEKDYPEVPTNLFLKHHHLANFGYDLNNQEKNLKPSQKEILIESWYSEIIITTFVQLFHSLITNSNSQARKFHHITNSIIIIDEIQALPHYFWRMIKKILKGLAENYNCWLIIMSATDPLLFSPNKREELVRAKQEGEVKVWNRNVYNFDLDAEKFTDFKQKFLQAINDSNDDVLAVLNTISSARSLYHFLSENLEERIADDQVKLNYLSTHLTPKDRLGKIRKIQSHKGGKRILISTQLVEAGVDISFDRLYRDFAPLDSIIQAGGRCNRNREKEWGKVFVKRLVDDLSKTNRLFCSYIYDSVLLDATKETIEKYGEKVKSYKDLKEITDYYFELVKERADDGKSEEYLNNIDLLNYSKISKFSLIENKFSTLSILVEQTEEVKQLRRDFEGLLGQRIDYNQRIKLKRIKSKLDQFTIDIKYSRKGGSEKLLDMVNSLPSLGTLNDFRYIPRGKLEYWYRSDIGFSPQAKAQSEMSII